MVRQAHHRLRAFERVNLIDGLYERGPIENLAVLVQGNHSCQRKRAAGDIFHETLHAGMIGKKLSGSPFDMVAAGKP